MKVKKQRIIFSYILLELLLLNISTLFVVYAKSFFIEEKVYSSFVSDGYFPLTLIYNMVWILIILLNGNQDLYIFDSYSKRVKDLIFNSFIMLGMSSTIILVADLEDYPLTILLGPIVMFGALNLIVFSVVFRFAGNSGVKGFSSNLLVLGAGKSGKDLLSFTEQNRHLGYKVVGFLDDHYPGSNGITLLGRLNDLSQILDSREVDEIVIALPPENHTEIKQAIKVADYRGVRVNLVPEYTQVVEGSRVRSYTLGQLPVLQLKGTALDQFHNFIFKKGFDLLFATGVLIMLSPVLLTIALLIKLTSKGPVFYKPIRKGQAGEDFVCYKFRTMYVDNGANAGQKSTAKDDPRITKIGKILRKYSLDELPQFINVLKGDMSVVGPRPHRINLNHEFQRMVEKYMIRHYVKPGITGWAQVNGWRGPTETMEQKLGRVKHDLWYIENWSFWLDIKIIWLTVFGSKVHNNAF